MLWLCYGPLVISFSFYFRFYNFLNQIKENSEIFHHVFCPSEMFSWTCDIFLKIAKPSFSESGSNKKKCRRNSFQKFYWHSGMYIHGWYVALFTKFSQPSLPLITNQKVYFLVNHVRKCNLGTKSCIIITLNLITAIYKHLKWKYKKITLIRYGLVYVFQHRKYKPWTYFNFVDVIVDSQRVINKKYTNAALAIARSRIFIEIFEISVCSCCPVWNHNWWLQIVLGA